MKPLWKTLCLLTVIAASLTVLPGCMGKNNVLRLTSDSLNQGAGFESMVFWRLRVTDHTNGFKDFYPSFFVSDPKWFEGEIENRTDKWREENGIACFDGVFAAQARPGDYEIRKIHLPLGSSIRHDYRKTVETSTFFEIPLGDKTIAVPPGRSVYMGEFEVVIQKKELIVGKGTVYTYTLKTNQDPAGYDEAQKAVRKRFPALHDRFRNKTGVAAYYLLHEDFNLLDEVYKKSSEHNQHHYKRGWTNRKNGEASNAYFSDGRYIVESKTASSCPYLGIRPGFSLPVHYDIELTSIWKSGSTGHPYGLVIGADQKNYYLFAASGSGHAKAALLQETKNQPDLLPWKAGMARPGEGKAENIHKISVRDDVLTYYVNGQELGTLKNQLKLDNWFVGVSVCGQQNIAFDDLKIMQR